MRRIVHISAYVFLALITLSMVISLVYIAGHRVEVARAASFALSINSYPMVTAFIILVVIASMTVAIIGAGIYWQHRMDVALEIRGEEITGGELGRLRSQITALEVQLSTERRVSRVKSVKLKKLHAIIDNSTAQMRSHSLDIMHEEEM
jgi:hypothetical protein